MVTCSGGLIVDAKRKKKKKNKLPVSATVRSDIPILFIYLLIHGIFIV